MIILHIIRLFRNIGTFQFIQGKKKQRIREYVSIKYSSHRFYLPKYFPCFKSTKSLIYFQPTRPTLFWRKCILNLRYGGKRQPRFWVLSLHFAGKINKNPDFVWRDDTMGSGVDSTPPIKCLFEASDLSFYTTGLGNPLQLV